MNGQSPIRDDLPGADLVAAGLRDLAGGAETIPALLVCLAATRLRRLGIEVPARTRAGRASHQLYAQLVASDPRSAHSRYNALVARLASFSRAAEHAGTR